MTTLRLRSLVLLLALAVAAPSSRAAQFQTKAQIGGGAAVAQAALTVAARPELASMPDTAALLGRLRLELALNPGSPAALSFLAQLPSHQAASLGTLPIERQLQVLEPALAAESVRLQAQAKAALARVKDGGVSKEDLAELDSLTDRWFYLSPELVQAVAEKAYEARAAGALSLADRVASQLAEGKEDKPKDVVVSELGHVFEGAAAIVSLETGRAPGAGLVGQRLAPYVAKALDDAEERVQERGLPAGSIYATLLKGHTQVFGKVADRSLFKTLRERGEWTEFAAAASLHAANKLSQLGAEHRPLLAEVAEGDELRLPIPAWHPLAGMFPSVAHWLASVHGPAEDESKGKLLFKVGGIPVKADRTMIIALVLGAFHLGGMFATAFKGQLPFAITAVMGLAATALLYATVVAHELGHAAAARAFGIRTRYIVINWLGGGARVVRGFRQALPEFVIALAGPVVSALCGVALVGAALVLKETPLGPIFKLIGSLNFMLAAYNLLPIFPMDGGRIMRAGLTRLGGSYRGTRIAGALSFGFALLLAFAGVSSMLAGQGGLLMVVFGGFFALASRAMGVHPGTVTIDERPSKKG